MSQATEPLRTMTAYGKRTTPFGAEENPVVLERTKGRNAYRIDLLLALREIWGDLVVSQRSALYSLVSGSCSDTQLQQICRYFYTRSTAFSNYANYAHFFGDPDTPYICRLVRPARQLIQQEYERASVDAVSTGCVVLGTDHDYLYVAAPNGMDVTAEGWEHVC